MAEKKNSSKRPTKSTWRGDLGVLRKNGTTYMRQPKRSGMTVVTSGATPKGARYPEGTNVIKRKTKSASTSVPAKRTAVRKRGGTGDIGAYAPRPGEYQAGKKSQARPTGDIGAYAPRPGEYQAGAKKASTAKKTPARTARNAAAKRKAR